MLMRFCQQGVQHIFVLIASFLLCITLITYPWAYFPVEALPIELNLHLPLRLTASWRLGCPYSEALRSNLALKQASEPDKIVDGDDGDLIDKTNSLFPDNGRGEQIDFFHLHSPHVTLYLTNFDVAYAINGSSTLNSTKVNSLLSAISNATSSLHACEISLNYSFSVSGTYAMWIIPDTECLQNLSDAVVTAASTYMYRPPTIPDWVRSLPEPERSMRIELVMKYGSPNVMEMFSPHVTVGYDITTSAENRRKTMESLKETKPSPICSGIISAIRVGETGVGGTVLQGGIIGEIRMAPRMASVTND